MSERACERRATNERAQSVWASERASERKASKRGARASAERASAERDGIARHDEHPNTTMRSARDAAPARSFAATDPKYGTAATAGVIPDQFDGYDLEAATCCEEAQFVSRHFTVHLSRMSPLFGFFHL